MSVQMFERHVACFSLTLLVISALSGAMVNASAKQQRGGFLCHVLSRHFYLTFYQTNIKSILCSVFTEQGLNNP